MIVQRKLLRIIVRLLARIKVKSIILRFARTEIVVVGKVSERQRTRRHDDNEEMLVGWSPSRDCKGRTKWKKVALWRVAECDEDFE